MQRRTFLQTAGGVFAAGFIEKHSQGAAAKLSAQHGYTPGRIPNEYSLFLPGEKEALAHTPKVTRVESGSVWIEGSSQPLRPGQTTGGWFVLSVFEINGDETAIFEKNVTYQGAIIYMTRNEGVILRIPKRLGYLSHVRPRPINAKAVRFTRQTPYHPGPDRLAEYILHSNEDPSYENVAALGPEYIGWTLVGNEQGGPLVSLFLEADGKSRQLQESPGCKATWAPDHIDLVFDPASYLPGGYPALYRYVHGYSKRTLLGGYLPVANTGVWNPETKSGYEVIVV
ncbi:MAG: hypothetical protein ACRD6B_03975, partial [Bryobacteraceae bacterium]